MASLPISLDQGMIDQIAKEFDLRAPNKEGLRQLIFHLTGEFDPLEPLVMNMATGAGKTYLMAAAVEYFRRQGMHNIMVVTPSLVVQDKTVQNFQHGSRRYVDGFQVAPDVVSPQSYDAWRVKQATLFSEDETDPSMVFVFNVQQLVAPKKTDTSSTGTLEGQRTKIRKFQEDAGSLYEYLTELDDLIVIADESHLYGSSAKAFNQALRDLTPAATIGLTASASKGDTVIYRYPLYKAISDGYVKTPVLVYRKSGYKGEQAEERQLRDALSLLRNKETAYQAYLADHPEAKKIAPALFVVGSNVEHATETATLLRGPGYCGDHQAVLQVDNQHDDERTRKLLDDLDNPNSPVRVVVSVDKLKEGWDTKRIAVMCTLRAMASEVLTQQTMGRGLRLPFGQRTGYPRIDQLDILAHTSFEELLNDEDILQTFGLDGAVDGEVTGEDILQQPPAPAQQDTQPQASPDVPPQVPTEAPAAVELAGAGSASHATGTGTAGAEHRGATVHTQQLDDEEAIEEDEPIFPVTVEINPRYAGTTFLFPSSTMVETITPFHLKQVRDEEIEKAAKRVTDSGEVLHRKKIVVSEGGHEITTQRVEDATVASALVDKDEVAKQLTRQVAGLRQITQHKENIAQLRKRIIPAFMDHAPVGEWTEKAKDSAVAELERLIKDKVTQHARNTQTETTITPVELPIDQFFTLPIGQDVLDLVGEEQREKFQLRKFYGPWDKGLFPAASFDSWSGEYLLAMKLNYSEEIVWWKRLYRHEGASIAYSTRDNYFPDFVAQDQSGTYWIIEGKSDKGQDDAIVQKKREAAVDLVNELISAPEFEDTSWGYLIAYESDVKTADSWEDLKTKAQPVVTKKYQA
ncbi:DEAD/DEAH box helicase [Corynebacterium halotolerans]|uniref:DEAD/DEAH box helicase n=1 Tax=Corynebacterium halotolerans TaxID=225326 RepID=UPI003CEE729C